MKKRVIASLAKQSLTIISAALLLAACGDEVTEVTNIYQSGLEVVDSVKDLPKCNDENVGEQAVVKGETSIRVCIDGDWVVMTSDAESGDFACKTEELKDGSGLKIVCNGDSIGVVLNGSDGKDGKAGKDGKDGDDGKDGEDGKDAVLPNDTATTDSERVPVSFDSLVGYAYPFLKGSTVYLYELSDGRTLKQANVSVGTSYITHDDYRYKFIARELASQYAVVVVEGFFSNEGTGVAAKTPIRLKAITDIRNRDSVNVNILTHLEFERVYYLVTKKGMDFNEAKRQAQQEILKEFYIEIGDYADAENLDIFGESDGDAALLAISLLLQGNRRANDLMALLGEISLDMAEDGKWDGVRADTIKGELANWAMDANFESVNYYLMATAEEEFGVDIADWRFWDTLGNSFNLIADFRKKNFDGEKLAAYEKFIHRFYSIESGMGICGSDSVPEGIVKGASNTLLKNYYAEDRGPLNLFSCMKDDSLFYWHSAKNLEKDTMGCGTGSSDGEICQGKISGIYYYTYESSTGIWRHSTILEMDTYNHKCSDFGQIIQSDIRGFDYFCDGKEWRRFLGSKIALYEKMEDKRDGRVYRTIKIGNQTWMAENLNYEYKLKLDGGESVSYGNACFIRNEGSEYQDVNGYLKHYNVTYSDNCTIFGRYYTLAAAVDSAAVFSDGGAGCGFGTQCNIKSPIRGICPEGWHLPTYEEWDELIDFVGEMSAGKALRARYGWAGAPVTDEYGFSALPFGDLYGNGSRSLFFSVDQNSNGEFYYVYMRYDEEYLTFRNAGISNSYYIRCVKDE